MVGYQLTNTTRIFFYSLIFLFSARLLNAQNELDSLRKVLKTSKTDTNKLILLNALIELAPEGEWEKYNEQMGAEVTKLLTDKNPKVRACALSHNAVFINNNGFIAYHYGDVQKALNCYHQSLKIQEQLKKQSAVALAYNNIGFVYSGQGDMEMALNYYKKGLAAYSKINDQDGIALCLNNIGYVYDLESKQLIEKNAPLDSILPKYYLALSYYKKSQKIHEAVGDKFGVANGLNNIAGIYSNLAELWQKNNIKKDSIDYYRQLELEYNSKALKMMEELGDLRGVALSNNNIGWHYYRSKDYTKAEEQSLKSMKIAKELRFPGNMRDAGKLLFLTYKAQGKYKEALEMHELFITMRDSIQNEKNKKTGIQKQIQYEYDKKAAADSVKVAEEKKVVAAQLKEERTQRFALYGGLALVILFAGFIFNRFKTTQKQNRIIEKQKSEVEQQRDIIEHQKELVDEKQKEIVDSITYARRIQAAMLTSENYISNYLNEYFIYYKPKDIVSGDFYWAVQHTGKFFFVTADCTGHGVPGAFMSLLNISFLNENIIEKNIIEPSAILNEQRTSIIKALNQVGSEESKDGMDCILCCFDFDTLRLDYAAANNSFYIVRDGNILELAADKMPVGKSPGDQQSFTLRSIQLQKDDMVYTLTDGYPDQFGGPRGKKFKYKQLEEILVAVHKLPVSEQKTVLSERFDLWRGNLEQLDDVCVVGIRI